MELQSNNQGYYERRIYIKGRAPPPAPAVRWFKEWVPQELVATGGKCSILKWITEDMLQSIKEKNKEQEEKDMEPEPTTEILFLCSFEGCGKTFIDAGSLRKHAHIHGERQYICTYEGCGRKFLDSSKLKRHFLIHTGERDFVCPHEGCGKAFSLDFNLRAHMKTHSLENYHVCPYRDCGKRYTHECKLKTHIKANHEKIAIPDMVKHPTPPVSKPQTTLKSPSVAYGSASSDRPFVCPYEGCGKDYIHEYKLNLHLRREHPGHNSEENARHAPLTDNDIDEASDQEAHQGISSSKNLKRKMGQVSKMPMSKSTNPKSTSLAAAIAAPKNTLHANRKWQSRPAAYEEDSEETEEDQENLEDGWGFPEANGDDDEETEDED